MVTVTSYINYGYISILHAGTSYKASENFTSETFYLYNTIVLFSYLTALMGPYFYKGDIFIWVVIVKSKML